MQKPIMEWNTQKKIWQLSTEDHLFVLSEPFLGTWQTSGTMRNGQVYELQTQEPHTKDSESSLLPTVTTQDGKNNAGPSQFDRNTKPLNVEAVLMGTPRTSSANGSSAAQVEEGAPKARIEDQVLATNWGRFEPAIRRWEAVLGRPAPFPTKPDGKDGAHRLSSAFTEWMMGLPEGWVTGADLTRNEELRACGNGVVPQQAELALRFLLEGTPIPAGGGQVNLPTPTVSDIFTDNLKSSQQKEGSMHSVTLPQAVKWTVKEGK